MSRIKAAIIDDGVDVSQFSNIQSFTVKKDLSIKRILLLQNNIIMQQLV